MTSISLHCSVQDAQLGKSTRSSDLKGGFHLKPTLRTPTFGWRPARAVAATLLLGIAGATAGQATVSSTSAQAAGPTPSLHVSRNVGAEVPTVRHITTEVPSIYRYNDVRYQLVDANGGIIATSSGIPAPEGMHWDFADTNRDRGDVYVRAQVNTATAALPVWSSAWSPQVLMMHWADVPAPKAHLKIAALTDSVGVAEGTKYGLWYQATSFDAKTSTWHGRWTITNRNPVWEPTDNPDKGVQNCHRSDAAFPNLAAASLGGADLLQLGCSGASVFNGFLKHQTFGDGSRTAGPQLGSKLYGAESPNLTFDAFRADLALVMDGADDVHFDKVVTDCFTSFYNLGRVTRYCDTATEFRSRVDQSLIAQKSNYVKLLDETIRRMRAAGKTPRVIAFTYYDPFPSSYKTCQDILPIGGKLGLSPGELAYLKNRLLALNDNIRAIAKKYPGVVKVVDLESAFKGHEWCSKDPWAYGPSIAMPGAYPGNPSPFHPTWYGQTIIRDKTVPVINSWFRVF
ncbi:MAG TPA: GDSL-type esterase/lipase family protein [Candidatus Saccharimonadia bacterium]